MLRDMIKQDIRSILGPNSLYPIPQGVDVEVMGDENLAHAEFYSPIAMVLSRTIHKPANEIGSYLVNGLVARGYNSRMTNAGFVEVFE